MLKRFTVENFKSFKQAELQLTPLTIVVGANASGKTNLIEALQILSWVAEGQRLDTLPEALEKRDVAVRGAPSELLREVGAIHLGCSTSGAAGGADLDFSVSIELTGDGFRIVDESLAVAGQPASLYQVETVVPVTGELVVSYGASGPGGKRPRIRATTEQAVLTQLRSPARFEAEKAQTEIPAAVALVELALRNILVLDPSPGRMRDYAFRIEHKKLRADGGNLSAVLGSLCADPELKSAVLAFVRALPEQDIVDIRFLEGPRGDVMLELVETFGARERAVSAALLSDGTLRVLAVAAAVLSMPRGSLVVIEEADNGVHPPRARAVLDAISQAVATRDVRVLLTTHSPALLSAIPQEAVPDVVACYRDPADGTSKLIRLDDIEDYPELVAQGPLGHVVTTGLLDRVIKHPRTPESREADLNRFLAIVGEQ